MNKKISENSQKPLDKLHKVWYNKYVIKGSDLTAKKGIDTMTKKITKRDMFNIIKDTYPTNSENYEEVIDFCKKQIELLGKKSEEKKMTPTQIENEKIMKNVLNEMEADKRYTITEMRETLPAFNGLSSQRATALVGILRTAGSVEREVEKGVAYFKLTSNVEGE